MAIKLVREKEPAPGTLGRPELYALAIGQVIGAGVITLIVPAIKMTGYSAWLAYFAAIIMGFFMILPTVFVSSTVRLGGGEYSMLAGLAGPNISGIYAFMYLTQCLSLSLFGTSAAAYLGDIIPALNSHGARIVVGAGLLTLFYIINLLGIDVMAAAQKIMTWLLIAALILFAIFGIAKIKLPIFDFSSPEFLTHGWGLTFSDGQISGGFVGAMLLFVYSTTGYFVTTAYGGASKNAKRDSLKQEGISYLAGAELPAVIVNMVRGGPGLGSIQPSQCDYFQATRGGGNGDYRTIVLAPGNIQEAVDLVQDAFDLADQYRNPVVVLADGLIGQMMEPITWRERPRPTLPEKTWATSGRRGRAHNNFITSLRIDAPSCEAFNQAMEEKYRRITEQEIRYETAQVEDAELILAAYGSTARIASTAMKLLRAEGIRAGLFRPVTLWPFPMQALRELAGQAQVKGLLTVEMSAGQMVDDVNLAVQGQKPVVFFGRTGGSIPTVQEIVNAAKNSLGGWRK